MTTKTKTREHDDDNLAGAEVLDVDTLNESPGRPVEPKLVMKGARAFRHDLFKAEVAPYRKNVSWKFGQPNLVNTEHCHFFHTYDSNGRPQTKTNAVGGHYHEIEWKVNDNGDIVAECGPPIHMIDKDPVTRKRWKKPKAKPVGYYSHDANDGEGGLIMDNHTHKMTYIHSENLNQDKIRAKQREASEFIQQSQSAAPQ